LSYLLRFEISATLQESETPILEDPVGIELVDAWAVDEVGLFETSPGSDAHMISTRVFFVRPFK